jgi:uncharacterized protein YaaN involved in tellurite resistance
MELAPPEPLQAPQPVEAVPETQAGAMVKLEDDVVEKLDTKVEEFVDIILASEVHSKPFEEKATAIHNLGNQEIREAAQVSNRFLDRPVKAMQDGVFDDGSPVSQALVDLRKTVEELDPSQNEGMLSEQKILGIIPLGKRTRNYFLKYQSSQSHINAIMNTLQQGQDVLRKDNATIEQEKVNMWQIMQRLRQYIYVGQKLDQALEAKIAEIEAQDPEKARIVREEMLFYVRQKVQDLLTQLSVSIQGYLALDLVRKNNLELIKGVDRATTTTVSALRTAIIVAQALTNQKLVLDQITALNTTTSNLIVSTSAMLKGQSAQIQEQASSAAVGVEQLQMAFNNIYETMDMISTYKTEALDTMKQTVNVLSTEVEKARAYVDRVQNQALAEVTEDLAIAADADADQEDDDVVSL